jgi:hypothetical protein
MNDPSQEILTAFEDVLDGHLTHQGDTWPVYLENPKSEGAGYVVLTDLNWFDDGGDDDMDCSLSMEIVSNQPTIGQMKLSHVNAISSLIVGLISKKNIAMTSYLMRVLPYIEDNDIFFDEAPDGSIIRKILRFRFVCKKK